MMIKSVVLQQFEDERSRLLNEYFNSTKLLDVLQSYLSQLTEQYALHRQLIANPYPSLVRRLRRGELLSFFYYEDTTSSSRYNVDMLNEPLGIGVRPEYKSLISSVRLLGLLDIHTVQKTIKRWTQLLPSSWFAPSTEQTQDELMDEGCTVQSFGVLTQLKSLITSDLSEIALEKHVFVTSDALESAITVFGRQLIRLLHETTTQNQVYLPILTIGPLVQWTMDKLQEPTQRQSFLAVVKNALVANEHPIELTMLIVSEELLAVVRCKLNLIFHFALSAGPKTTPRTKTVSFLTHSQLNEEFVCFFSEQGAQLCKVRAQEFGKPSTARKSASNEDLLESLVRICVEKAQNPVEFSDLLGKIKRSVAFTCLLCVVRLQSIRQLLKTTADWSVVQTYWQHCMDLVSTIQSSGMNHLLRSHMDAISRSFTASTPKNDQMHPLQAFEALLRLIGRQEAMEIIRSLRCMLPNNPKDDVDDHVTGLPMIDVAKALDEAIEERLYPPAIVAEAVLARYLVDSRLAFAIESTLTHVLSRHLPPNPFPEVREQLQTFAVQQFAAFYETKGRKASKLSTQPIVSCELPLVTAEAEGKQVFGSNGLLLQLIDPVSIAKVFDWLTSTGVVRMEAYVPSRVSYTVDIHACLLCFRPLQVVFDSNPVAQSIELVEHVVIDGRDLPQALFYFADAVVQDLRRLVTTRSSAWTPLTPPSVYMRNANHEKVALSLDVADFDAMVQRIQEATSTQGFVEIAMTLVPVADPTPVLRLTKAYVFDYVASKRSFLSSIMAFRLHTFGVFLTREASVQCIKQLPLPPSIAKAAVTPDAASALTQQDQLRLHELQLMTSADKSTRSIDTITAHVPTWRRLLELEGLVTMVMNSLRLIPLESMPVSPRAMALPSVYQKPLDLLHRNAQEVLVAVTMHLPYLDTNEIQTQLDKLAQSMEKSTAEDGHATLMTALYATQAMLLVVRFAYQRDVYN